MQIDNLSWFPGHMTKTKRMISAEIKNMDAVCEIVDARIPLSSRNPDVDELTAGKPRLIVLNRADQADPAETRRWTQYFRAQGYAVLEANAKNGVGTDKFSAAGRELLRDTLAAAAARGQVGKVVRVMVLGVPNVGKSTLISTISAARPKIANYHFTTLTPVLGVVRVVPEQSFVCADIPGLIEGAADGVGLGHDFLRHVERCRLLLHVVDVSGSECRDPIEDFEKINEELAKFSPALAERPQINRFVMNGRIFRRNDIQISFAVKRCRCLIYQNQLMPAVISYEACRRIYAERSPSDDKHICLFYKPDSLTYIRFVKSFFV